MRAAEACLAGGGQTRERVDMAGAMALAQAEGVPQAVAAALLPAAADGIKAGLYDRRRDDP
jgi:hypothetical protein